jgi:hypothetical protein
MGLKVGFVADYILANKIDLMQLGVALGRMQTPTAAASMLTAKPSGN